MQPKNPGQAIKKLAIILFFLISIGVVIFSLILFGDGSDTIDGLLSVVIIVPISMLVGVIFYIPLYGFGELVEQVKNIDEKIAFNQLYNSMPQQANFGTQQYSNANHQMNFNAQNTQQQMNFNAPQCSEQHTSFNQPQQKYSPPITSDDRGEQKSNPFHVKSDEYGDVKCPKCATTYFSAPKEIIKCQNCQSYMKVE